ncbi:MAG: CdaR family protein [Anaerolineae bacterium]
MRQLVENLGSVVLALALALTVWVVAAREENPIQTGRFQEPIPIEVSAAPTGTKLWTPVRESVLVTLRAPKSSWDRLRPESFQARVDISSLAPGLHEVPVSVACSDPEVQILSITPERISVRLERLAEKIVPVRVEVVDAPPFGYYQPGPAVAEPATVRVSGFASYVEQVAEAAVEVSVAAAKKPVELRRVPQLRDAQHLPVDTGTDPYRRLEVEPASILVRVPIEQRRGFRDVSVRVVREGQPAPGYRISNVSVEPAIVTVVGSPSVIEALPGYVDTEPVTVEGATSDVVTKVSLQLPEMVSVLDVQGVLVRISITPIESSLTIQRPVRIQGLPLGFSATASPATVDIILSGPLPLLDNLKPEAVHVFVDLLGLPAGVHQVRPQTIVPENLRVESIVPEMVEVSIVEVPTPTPFSTPFATPPLTVTPTVTVTATVTGTFPAAPATPEGVPTPTPPPATPTPTPVPTPPAEERNRPYPTRWRE